MALTLRLTSTSDSSLPPLISHDAQMCIGRAGTAKGSSDRTHALLDPSCLGVVSGRHLLLRAVSTDEFEARSVGTNGTWASSSSADRSRLPDDKWVRLPVGSTLTLGPTMLGKGGAKRNPFSYAVACDSPAAEEATHSSKRPASPMAPVNAKRQATASGSDAHVEPAELPSDAASSRPPQAFRLTPIAPGWGLPGTSTLNADALDLREMLSEVALRGAFEVQLHSYLLDLDWVLEACPALSGVPKVLVVHGDGRCLTASCLTEPRHAGRFVLLEPPTTKGKGVHHSKMVVVRSAAALSLHVTTANLTFTSFAAKTNATWSGHFPRRAGAPSPPAAETFGADLHEYLDAMKELGACPPSGFGVHKLPTGSASSSNPHSPATPSDNERWDTHFSTEWVHDYDFSGTEARLVATVPPRNEKVGHTGVELHRWGQARLRKLLTAVDDSAWHGSELVMQFSSMGMSRNQEGWLRQMATAFCPNDTQLPPMSIVFPTTREVRDSLEGWVAGHSIPCQDANAIGTLVAALQQHERESGRPDYTATQCAWDAGERARAVPHMKSFTRCRRDGRGSHGGGRGALRLPWVVVGSHNLSKAAWGELSADRKALLACKAYELSVLVAARSDDAPLFASPPTEEQRRTHPHAAVAPLPFLPPTPYAPGDTCWLSSSQRSNSVTDALPPGIAGNTGSTDHHGRKPEAYNDSGADSTATLIYGPDPACKLLLDAWATRTHGPASADAASSAASSSSSASMPAVSAAPAASDVPLAQQHEFCEAAKRQDFAAVKAKLEATPALVNVQPAGRWSALHQFAQAGHVEAVQYLLSKGASCEAKTKQGQTPLEVARMDCCALLGGGGYRPAGTSLPPAAIAPPASPLYALMITGSRSLNEGAYGGAIRTVVYETLDAQVRALRANGKGHRLELLSGHAEEGVDTLAEAWAEARGVAVRRFPIDWGSCGPSAEGVNDRNLEMLQLADGVVAIWDLRSPGTRHALEEARRAGKLLRLVAPLEPQPHVVLLLVEDEDAACVRSLAACRDNCAPHVHDQCFQRDGTRHATLYKELKLSPLQAARVAFATPPRLPVTLRFDGFQDWSAGVYLALDRQSGRGVLEALTPLQGLPAGARVTDLRNLHVSLYRKRGVGDEAKPQFSRVRGACGGLDFGTALGRRIVIKPMGETPYEDARVLHAAPTAGDVDTDCSSSEGGSDGGTTDVDGRESDDDDAAQCREDDGNDSDASNQSWLALERRSAAAAAAAAAATLAAAAAAPDAQGGAT